MEKQEKIIWKHLEYDTPDLVSIHIPVYHYRLSPVAIACVCLQTFKNWQCYLVDDPEGTFDIDEALDLIESWGIEVPRDKFHYLKHPDSDWLHDKRNYLIDHTQEPLICNLDDDDYFYPEYLETLVRNLLQDDTCFGNFRGQRQSYHLQHRFLVEDYVGGSGSGHWIYRRDWRDHYDIRYDVFVENGVKLRRASDEMFLRCIEKQIHEFNRNLYYFHAEKGLAIRFRHGRNTCRFGLRGVDDPDLDRLRTLVDERIYPYYVLVANEIQNDISLAVDSTDVYDRPIVCMATYGRKDAAHDAAVLLAREAPKVVIWNNDDYDLSPLPSNVSVINSPNNIGPIGRFIAALTQEDEHVIFWDDDMRPVAGWYEKWCRFLPWVRNGAVVGFHGFRFVKQNPQYHTRCKIEGKIEHADYIGTGGMMCKRKYINTRPIWQLESKLRFCNEDIALCVGARKEYDADLLCVPALKDWFTWQEESNATALYLTHYKKRCAGFAELFPDVWEFAADRQIRTSHPLNYCERDGEALFNDL